MWICLRFPCLSCTWWVCPVQACQDSCQVVRLPYLWYSILNQVPVSNFRSLRPWLPSGGFLRSAAQCPYSLLSTAPHSACPLESPAECISRTVLSLSLEQLSWTTSSWLLTCIRIIVLSHESFLGVWHSMWTLTWLHRVLRTTVESPWNPLKRTVDVAKLVNCLPCNHWASIQSSRVHTEKPGAWHGLNSCLGMQSHEDPWYSLVS